MLLIVEIAAALAATAAQVAAASPIAIAEAGGNAFGLNHLEAVLSDWRQEGVIAHPAMRMPPHMFEACVVDRRIDDSCVRRSPEARDRVMLFAQDTGRRNSVLRITCVGADGTGEVEIDVNQFGSISASSGVRERARQRVADCIRAAARDALRLPDA